MIALFRFAAPYIAKRVVGMLFQQFHSSIRFSDPSPPNEPLFLFCKRDVMRDEIEMKGLSQFQQNRVSVVAIGPAALNYFSDVRDDPDIAE